MNGNARDQIPVDLSEDNYGQGATEISRIASDASSPLFLAVESDVVRFVEHAVEHLDFVTGVDSVDVVDAMDSRRDVARLAASARRDQTLRFIVVPVGARWLITHLTSIPEDRVRWALL